jgi:Mn2+/Fe2+ NRAMP family transporter
VEKKMKKLKPNYIAYLFIMLIASSLLLIISKMNNLINLVQVIVLMLSPFILTFGFKNSMEASPYGYFFNENGIVFKSKKEEISIIWSDVNISKILFFKKITLKKKICFELLLYQTDEINMFLKNK